MRPRALIPIALVLLAAGVGLWTAGPRLRTGAGSVAVGGSPDTADPLAPAAPETAADIASTANEPAPLAPLSATDDEASARLESLGGRLEAGATGAGGGDLGSGRPGAAASRDGARGAGPGAGTPPTRDARRETRDAPAPDSAVAVGSLTGRVVRRSDGAVVVGAEVRVFKPNQGPDQAKHATTTDDEGRFALAVPAGPIAFEARAGAHAPTVVAGLTVEAAGTTDAGDVALADGALVTGRVTGADEQPRAGVTVRAFAVHQGAREVTTDAAGQYRMDGLAPANYFFEVKNAPAGDVFPVVVVTLELGQRKTLDFGVTPGVALVVQVTRDGAPCADAEVRFISRAGTFGDVGLKMDDVRTATTRTDAAGAARFAHLVPGPYDVVVSHRDRDVEGKHVGPNRVVSQRVTLAPGAGVVSVVIVYPSAAVTGQVTDAATGAPLAGVRVVLEPAELRATRNLADKLVALGQSYAGTDGDGRFTVPHVAPGDYSLACLKSGYAAAVVETLRVGASGMQGIRVALQPGGGKLALTVTVAGGRAVQGCFGLLRDPSGADAGIQGISLEGTATFEGLRAGTHTLLVFAPNHPVFVREGVMVAEGATTEIAVDVPPPPEAAK